ncbi:hypothetical protein D3C71_1893920 [compost metagenome]
MAPHAGVVKLDRPGVGDALQIPFVHLLDVVVDTAHGLHALHAEHDGHEEDHEEGKRQFRGQGRPVVVLNKRIHETRSSLSGSEVVRHSRHPAQGMGSG